MPTIVTRFLNHLLGRPFAAKGILWSLGLHATAFAASCSWWSIPLAPVSFSGNRHVMQLEATVSEMPYEQEIETVLEFESVPPPEDLSPTDLPQLQYELVVAPPTLQLSDRPRQDDEAIEVKLPQSVVPPKESHEIKPVETPNKPRPQSDQPSVPEAATVVEQLAGVEDRSPPDLSGNRPPSYPAEAIRSRQEGVVLLRLTIAASGQVERVEVAISSGHAILDRTAVEAVSTWHARPAEQNSKPVATVELLPVRFKL